MGTTWSVRYPGGAETSALRPGIEAVLERVIAQMSGWRPDSDLCRFNAAPAGSRHAHPAEFATVLACALEIAEASDGAFDPTVAPLVNLWGFGPPPAARAMPEAQDIAQAMAHVGWRKLPFAQSRVLQPGGMGLDFSGIAKGHAVDLVAMHLASLGIASFLVEIGGELRGQGMKPDGSPWWVALESVPGAAAPGEDFVVALHGLSVATSGDYRRFFERDGRRYGHTLDPRTGWPVANEVASVTVLHPSCMRADAWATALSVLGVRDGLELATRQGIGALFVTREEGRLAEHMSPVFAAMLD
ncbi:FAD:protein FMN transferase [Roseococcus sp. SYP-B2431]|uniref:FAD:protein FMN transferase n=1 Tax=Roseococcus sp. SYP-B2431 TaxID=2496640 RepID=UPI0013F3F621|nr:FAD:protein FMN transferase [Roseococcus sp. SYP-B2431]